MIKQLLIFGMTLCISLAGAQDMKMTHRIVKELSSANYFGRGYINKGDSLAADYLSKEFKKLRLHNFNPEYLQHYVTPINTYPEDPELLLGDNSLEPARDFIVYPNSPACDGYFELVWLTAKEMKNTSALDAFLKKDLRNCFVAIDSTGLHNPELYKFAKQLISRNHFGAKGILSTAKKLKFSAKPYLKEFPTLVVKSALIDTSVHKIKVKIKNQYIEAYQTQNLIGYIPGKSDTCVVFCAHYDHLGMMGTKMFPGANDNASGVAMVLNLAKHYNKRWTKPDYTLVFLLFSGEEAGLLGSEYYVNNPLFPLEMTKFVMNFDMVGTGTHGLYIFNAKAYTKELALYESLNKENEYVSNLRGTRPVPSSDHANFYEQGVKAVFFYTAGGNDDYHECTDTYDQLTFPQFEGIFKLVTDFTDRLKTL